MFLRSVQPSTESVRLRASQWKAALISKNIVHFYSMRVTEFSTRRGRGHRKHVVAFHKREYEETLTHVWMEGITHNSQARYPSSTSVYF